MSWYYFRKRYLYLKILHKTFSDYCIDTYELKNAAKKCINKVNQGDSI